ncbi:hypothetical protein FACS1894122_08420 [Alphaproteobacteria bacterium]|nr:hypothetical protein FACS1894122_08420 [Alphaproteobacteria bacterium]
MYNNNINLQKINKSTASVSNSVTLNPFSGASETYTSSTCNAEATSTKINASGATTLKHMTDHGIKLIGCYDSGAAIASGEEYKDAFTSDITEIQNLMQGNGDKHGHARGQIIRLFRFIPADAGFVCIDIDRGHANGIDGLAKFYEMFEKLNIFRPQLPKILQDIENGSFPVYTNTPSGGFHLYFKYKGQAMKKCIPTQNVEIFHANGAVAAPGSIKNNKPYIFHGSLDDAPKLPPLLEKIIHQSMASEDQWKAQPKFTYQQPRDKSIPTLEKLAEYAENDGNYAGRNELCFEIARRAARYGDYYSQSEIISFLRSYPGTSGHKQIKDAVSSAYKYRRTRNEH